MLNGFNLDRFQVMKHQSWMMFIRQLVAETNVTKLQNTTLCSLQV